MRHGLNGHPGWIIWLTCQVLPQAAEAATRHVCPSACDHSSVQAAVDAASNGDVVEISPGTFRGLRLIGSKPVVADAGRVVVESCFFDDNGSDGISFEADGSGIVRNSIVNSSTRATTRSRSGSTRTPLPRG